MKPDAYLKLYPGDWLKDTLRLDATAMGAYFLLILDHRGKPGIPNDDQTLRTIARVRESDWMRVKGQISVFFKDVGGLWVNNRSVEDWNRDCADYQAIVARSNAAKAARWGKEDSESTQGHPQVDTQGHPQVMLKDILKESQSESESESESESGIKVKIDVGRNGCSPASICDDEWLSVLQKSEAYRGISVQSEYSKMSLWCQTKKHQPTRRRFLSWLNRIERPMTATPQRKPF